MALLFKRNQIEEAIIQTLRVWDRRARADELTLRLRRLLATDRRRGVDTKPDEEEEPNRYAFYSQEPQGSGTEIMFTGYEAFALLTAIILLEHGLPQSTVIRVMRRARRHLERAHAETLKKGLNILFDPGAALAKIKPGMIMVNNTDPVLLLLVRLTGSSTNPAAIATVVCQGHEAAAVRLGQYTRSGLFLVEVTGHMLRLDDELSRTHPIKRGRGATYSSLP